MESASVSALAVLAGSLVGALTSLGSTWLTQQHLDRRELLGRQIADRETLYANFISEAARAVVDAMGNSFEHVEGLVPLYALVGRIRLNSSEAVLTVAEQVVTAIITSYASPNLTPQQFQESVLHPREQRGADPLAEFSQVAREELRAMRAGIAFPDRPRRFTTTSNPA